MKKNAAQLFKLNRSLTQFRNYQRYTYKSFNFAKYLLPISLGVAGLVIMKDYEKFFPTLEAKAKPEPQDSVISGMHGNCGVVVIKLKNSTDFETMVKLCSKYPELVEKLTPKYDEEEELKPVLFGIGFDTTTWKKYSSKKKSVPEGLDLYKERKGQYGDLPKTEGEIILHVKAATKSLAYEAIDAFVKLFPSNKIESVKDFYGFQYQDGRDLSGFIDGTMNINGDDERTEAGVNSNGGSFLIHQRWEHNLDYFHSLPLKEQENVFGRSKDWSAEQDQKKMKIQAHVARMRDEKFNPIPIVRQSMPFGDVGKTKGLLFLGYSNKVSKFDQMLDQMTESKKSDLVMTYSKCVAGNYYYIPSKDELKKL
eukprot:gene2951-4961_t